jgi:hypothetical protein
MPTIIIRRTNQFISRFKAISILLDNQKIGDIAFGETKQFEVPEKTFELKARQGFFESKSIQIKETESDETSIYELSSPYLKLRYKLFLIAFIRSGLLTILFLVNVFLHNEKMANVILIASISWILLEFFFDKKNSILFYFIHRTKFYELVKVN